MNIIEEKEILKSEVIFQNQYNYISSNKLLNLNNLSIINSMFEKYNIKNKELNIVSKSYIYSFYKDFNIKKIIIPKTFNALDICKINKIKGENIEEIEYNISLNFNKEIEILLCEKNIKEISIEIISKKEVLPRGDNLIFIKY